MKIMLQNHGIHTFLIFLAILCVSVRAQSNNNDEDVPRSPGTNLYPYSRFTSSLAIILAVLITSVFFMIFFFIYIRHCSGSPITAGPLGRSRRAAVAVPRGLDASVIDTFPTFSYLEVKDHKIGKGALECAVCLNEFEDDETLRLLPKCDHVFHPECIDAWLGSHVTCPVCRADLVPQAGDDPVWVPDLPISNEETHESSNPERDSLRSDEIATEVGDVENQLQEMKGMDRNSSFQYPNRPPKGPVIRNMSFQYPKRPPKAPVNRNLSFGNLNRTPKVGLNRKPQRSLSMSQRMFGLVKFGRSKSMGNILVQPGEDVERFTLRLPSDVRKEVMSRALLNRTRSFSTTPPMDPNSRNDKVDRSNRQVKSDRWAFFTRALSMNLRSPRPVTEIGESSNSKGSKSKTLEHLRSFNCLESRGVHEIGYP